MSFHNLNDLKYTMVGKGMQRLKNGVCQGDWKNPLAVFGFP